MSLTKPTYCPVCKKSYEDLANCTCPECGNVLVSKPKPKSK